jgi:hypothetical protein
MMQKQAFASFDVETDGDNPLMYSMRSIGIALFVEESTTPIDSFYATISPRPGAGVDKKCMEEFWSKHPEQWKEVNTNCVDAKDAMANLSKWLTTHDKKYCIKFVASPANFDWMFLKSYYETFGPSEKYDIGFFCHDLTSLLRAYMIMNKIADKKGFLARICEYSKYTHNALDDAICQGKSYVNLRKLLSGNSI